MNTTIQRLNSSEQRIGLFISNASFIGAAKKHFYGCSLQRNAKPTCRMLPIVAPTLFVISSSYVMHGVGPFLKYHGKPFAGSVSTLPMFDACFWQYTATALWHTHPFFMFYLCREYGIKDSVILLLYHQVSRGEAQWTTITMKSCGNTAHSWPNMKNLTQLYRSMSVRRFGFFNF